MVTEFFVSDGEVWFTDDGGMSPLTEGGQAVDNLLDGIQSMYPQAYKSLQECYKRSERNVPYFKYLCARRFCRCNFGRLDHTEKDVSSGVFHFEDVSCPLRGECRHEGVICHPRMETGLSQGEERVMRLLCEGMSNRDISEVLYLSPNTVKRHISTAFMKTGAKSRSEFIAYAKKNNLFNQ